MYPVNASHSSCPKCSAAMSSDSKTCSSCGAAGGWGRILDETQIGPPVSSACHCFLRVVAWGQEREKAVAYVAEPGTEAPGESSQSTKAKRVRDLHASLDSPSHRSCNGNGHRHPSHTMADVDYARHEGQQHQTCNSSTPNITAPKAHPSPPAWSRSRAQREHNEKR
ncbi:uncharacterized protein VDAG_06920 [Verticillium dahliae VdLs.17]|uniref:Uncharacterized protein n=1 Tax=Verticillium dahliae (strain VdLs.17 / ATCC MYA-4575 / FGSC 10137) TaxID=498257 RepID=G2XA17_VERDV|nr:uncharacterized protein VDAG_06920 [Verticillium dahliae VdLs.17]EGY15756.1 hypothetical protein VDAG_06920 [Verticillium dahliae VdLs.17]